MSAGLLGRAAGVEPTLVLASASPRRVAVLRQLGLEPVVRPSDVDETYEEGESPAEHVERLARAKVQAVALDFPGSLVVGGDTVVLSEGRVLGKPRDARDAERMLASLRGRAHEVLTGLALAGEHGVVSGHARITVRFRDFDGATISGYVATGEPLDKAGAYGIQGQGAALVASIEGDYYGVVGFPVSVFMDLLERAGWRYDYHTLTRATR